MTSTTGEATSTSSWSIPRPMLLLAARVSLVLVVPIVGVYIVSGATAAVGLAMGYLGSIAPGLMLPRTRALSLVLLPAMAGAVAVAVNGQAFAAACFIALACLLVAPASILQNGLLAGVPTIAAVLGLIPISLDPVEVAGWMLVGGVIAVLVMAPLRKPAEPVGVDPAAAWAHAAVMGAAVGGSALWVTVFEVPHGYWICMTLTIVLRPFGNETLGVARERVLGTIGGAALALALAVLLPGWAALAVVVPLLLLMVAYAALGRTAQQVVFLTPVVLLLGSGGAGTDTLTVAIERVGATMLGAVLAALLALGLARADRARARRDASTTDHEDEISTS